MGTGHGSRVRPDEVGNFIRTKSSGLRRWSPPMCSDSSCLPGSLADGEEDARVLRVRDTLPFISR